jgi:tellurite resistance protein TerC
VFGRVLGTLAPALRASRKLVIAIAGASVLATGVLMLVLPGPAFIVIPAGLAILGVEFAWARRWLLHVKEHGERTFQFWRRGRDARS